jgi:hypothetical protein
VQEDARDHDDGLRGRVSGRRPLPAADRRVDEPVTKVRIVPRTLYDEQLGVDWTRRPGLRAPAHYLILALCATWRPVLSTTCTAALCAARLWSSWGWVCTFTYLSPRGLRGRASGSITRAKWCGHCRKLRGCLGEREEGLPGVRFGVESQATEAIASISRLLGHPHRGPPRARPVLSMRAPATHVPSAVRPRQHHT